MEQPKDQEITYHFLREKFVLPVRLWIYRVIRFSIIAFIVVLIINLLFSYLFFTPKMWRLRQDNREIVAKYSVLNSAIASDIQALAKIRKRDHTVYRSIFSADTLNIKGIWNDYPDSKYADAVYARYTPLILTSWQMMDALTRQIYLQSLSFDQVELLAVDKDMMAECIPAIWPINKALLRNDIGKFGGRIHPIKGGWSGHKGIDLAAPHGSPIYATAMGVVIPDVGHGTGYGIQVIIDHGFGYKTRYAHLSATDVVYGQVVKRGEVIGKMGSTGWSTGTHLHYEVIYRGIPRDPLNYFSRDMSDEEFRQIISRVKETIYEKLDQ